MEQVCGQFFVPVEDWVSRVQLPSVRVWVNVSPEQTDEVDGVQFWYVQDWQFFVPVMVRVSVEQALFVRACSKLFPWQMLLAAGAQPVAEQVDGQYLLPLALLVSGRAIRQGAGLCEYLPAAFGTRVRGPGGGAALIIAILCTGGLAVCSRTVVIGAGLFSNAMPSQTVPG